MILKMYEGVALLLMKNLKGIFTSSFHSKLAAALILKDLKKFKKSFDYNEYGGAPLVGCAKPVFKAHGSSKAKTFYNAIRLTKLYVEGHVTEDIVSAINTYQHETTQIESGFGSDHK